MVSDSTMKRITENWVMLVMNYVWNKYYTIKLQPFKLLRWDCKSYTSLICNNIDLFTACLHLANWITCTSLKTRVARNQCFLIKCQLQNWTLAGKVEKEKLIILLTSCKFIYPGNSDEEEGRKGIDWISCYYVQYKAARPRRSLKTAKAPEGCWPDQE